MRKSGKKILGWLSGVSLLLGLSVSTAVQYSALHAEYVTRHELKIVLLEREIEFIKLLNTVKKN